VLIKQLEPGMSHSKQALQKAAPTFFQPPPPTSPEPANQAASTIAPQPEGAPAAQTQPLLPNVPDRQMMGPYGQRRDHGPGHHQAGHERNQNQVQQNTSSQPQEQGGEPPAVEQGGNTVAPEDTGEAPDDDQ
jgi:hypothetical protein